MIRRFIFIVAVLGLAIWTCDAEAPTSCAPINQAALLALFPDGAGNSSITPANIRSIVCSMAGGPSGSATPNWRTGDIPVFGNSGLANNTTGPYLIDSGSAGPLGVECPPITQYGGKGDNVTDNAPALLAAFASQGSQACISFPPGQFVFKTAINYSLPTGFFSSLKLLGAGAGVTQLMWGGSTNFLTFTYNGIFQSTHFSDLSVIATTPCACTAISLVMGITSTLGFTGLSDFVRVNITGSDPSNNVPSGLNYFATGIDDFGISNVNFGGLYIQGIQNSSGPTPGNSRGVYIHGDAAHIPYAFNFTNTDIFLYGHGLEMGPYTQGITYTGGSIVGNMVGIYVSSLGGQGAAQLDVQNVAFNNCSSVYVVPPTPPQIAITGPQITNDDFVSNSQVFPCGSFTTTVSLGSGTQYGIVSGNIFGGLGSPTGTAINISGPNYQGGKAVNNMINNYAIGIDTTPTATPGTTFATGGLISGNNITNSTVGIQIGAFTDDYVISDNILRGNGTDLVNNTGNMFQNFVDIAQDCSAQSGVGFTFNALSTGITYSAQACRFSIINRQGFLDIDYTFSNKGTATGQLGFTMPGASPVGLPGGVGTVVLANNLVSLVSPMTIQIFPNNAGASFWQWTATGTGVVTDANITNTSRIAARMEFRLPTTAP